MKIYLDTSCLNRVFDDQTQPRIYLESSAMLLIFKMIEEDNIHLVSSEAIIYETDKNPYIERKIFVLSILKKAKQFQAIDDDIFNKSSLIEKKGIKGLDSIHLACAEKLKVEYFITCDDKIINKYKGKFKILNPIEFVMIKTKEKE